MKDEGKEADKLRQLILEEVGNCKDSTLLDLVYKILIL
jgi:hypothetical protein